MANNHWAVVGQPTPAFAAAVVRGRPFCSSFIRILTCSSVVIARLRKMRRRSIPRSSDRKISIVVVQQVVVLAYCMHGRRLRYKDLKKDNDYDSDAREITQHALAFTDCPWDQAVCFLGRLWNGEKFLKVD